MYQSIIKRILDIIGCLLLFPILLLVMIPIAIAIKIEDNGPVFFTSERWGKDMEPFKMYKFRSMKVNAPDIRNEDGTTYNSDDDPRVTKVGRFIRKTSLDELPQIINVLKGDMSLIGPRPSPPGDKSIYPEDFFLKYKVKPGITGYSQATVRNAASMDERIKRDKFYVENISFKLDCWIVIETIRIVLKRDNINRN